MDNVHHFPKIKKEPEQRNELYEEIREFLTDEHIRGFLFTIGMLKVIGKHVIVTATQSDITVEAIRFSDAKTPYEELEKIAIASREVSFDFPEDPDTVHSLEEYNDYINQHVDTVWHTVEELSKEE